MENLGSIYQFETILIVLLLFGIFFRKTSNTSGTAEAIHAAASDKGDDNRALSDYGDDTDVSASLDTPETLISKEDLSGKYLFLDDSKYLLLVISKVNVKDIIKGKIFFPSISSNINLRKKYYHTCFLEENGCDFPSTEPIEEHQLVHLFNDSNDYVKISSNMKHNQLPLSFKNISESTFNHWKKM